MVGLSVLTSSFIDDRLTVAIRIKHLSFGILDTLPAIQAWEMCFIIELSSQIDGIALY